MTLSNDELRTRLGEVARTYGDWVIWEQGLPCACRAASSLRMAAGCARCEGEGFIWITPEKLKGILLPAHSDRRLAAMGWLGPSDLTLSTDAYHPVHDFDRITLTTPLPSEPEIITRGQAYREGLPGLAPSEDRLSYQATEAITCVVHDRPDEPLVHGDAYVFVGKALRWLKPPADGTVYVVKYRAITEGIAFQSPFEIIDRGKPLGQRVLLRKRHMVVLRENAKRDVRIALGL